MCIRRRAWALLLVVAAMLLSGCASLQGRDPLKVTVVGIEPLEGQELELRMMVKLRVQNPNDTPVDYSGVALEMQVQGKSFASGVSGEAGSVPRFGETVISVPVTIGAFQMVQQALVLIQDGDAGKIQYEMKGKLSGSGFGTNRFTSKGEFDMHTGTGAPQPP
jgi:LEA14-like dessication related protein